MSRFIQSLEARTLFAATPVTKSTLLADQTAITADATTARADLKAIVSTIAADTKTIQADLKGLPKTNAPLLRALRMDEGKVRALITKDLNALLGPATGLSRRSTAQGVALMAHSNAALQARVAADVAALGTVTAAPLAQLQADEQGNGVGADLQAIALANPSDATLLADISKQQADITTTVNTLNNAALTFQTDIATLTSDVAAAPAGSGGTSGSTIPNLVATYSGSAKETSGNHVGRVSTLQLVISSEGTDGSLTGTTTLTESGNSVQLSLAGSVSANGTFTATLTDTSGQQNGATLTAHVSGKTISGTYHSTDGSSSGTFTVSKP